MSYSVINSTPAQHSLTASFREGAAFRTTETGPSARSGKSMFAAVMLLVMLLIPELVSAQTAAPGADARAGASGTNPAVSEGLGNPLNRNPAKRSNETTMDTLPVDDPRNSTTRPTVGATTPTDPARDTVVAPDPSRDLVPLPTPQ